ncbi:MAG: tRNA (adenosine(37)-N6)-threonylcarbamoyltransferase complex ATPase subunit type 1 TsaE [Desulfobulbus propionicus]|nr:MAG: tRNA (adenosine(37)-N6)-threonylcarbamoyltransferase complex ATPase subunit type 1 TsaE [Desulfobulbus propionicus]
MNREQLSIAGLDALEQFAGVLAPQLESGDVLLLHGDLGAGKTTLTQAVARMLDVDEEQNVCSPSFSLMHEYVGRLTLRHMDLYRLHGIDDVENAGLLEFIGAPGLCIIEWPDRLGAALPIPRLDIFLEPGTTAHTVILAGHGSSWQQRVAEVAASYRAL